MLPLTIEAVKGIIKQELDLADLPLDETFGTISLQAWQLNRIQQAVSRAFNKNVRPFYSDTVISLTTKIQQA